MAARRGGLVPQARFLRGRIAAVRAPGERLEESAPERSHYLRHRGLTRSGKALRWAHGRITGIGVERKAVVVADVVVERVVAVS